MAYLQRAENLDDRWARQPGTAAATPLPQTWTAARVRARLLEAFRIDGRLPRAGGPRSPGSAHPAVFYDAAERAEWERVDQEPDRFAPSRAERTFAATVFAWLMLLEIQLRLTLTAWMKTEARGGNHATHCRREGILQATFLDHVGRALALIALRLNRNAAPVF